MRTSTAINQVLKRPFAVEGTCFKPSRALSLLKWVRQSKTASFSIGSQRVDEDFDSYMVKHAFAENPFRSTSSTPADLSSPASAHAQVTYKFFGGWLHYAEGDWCKAGPLLIAKAAFPLADTKQLKHAKLIEQVEFQTVKNLKF